MTHDEILAKLTDIFRDVLGDDDLVLSDATTAEDVEDWDSVNHVTLLVATEVAFGIKFATAETESLKNVGHLAALIQRKLAAKGR